MFPFAIRSRSMSPKVNLPTDAGADIANVSAAVTRKFKELRKARGLSLDQLSRASGVSKGMLVEIEKGAANPSIAILCKAAVAFGVSVADMVNVSNNSPVRLVDSREIPTLWHGPMGGSARLLAGTKGPEILELWSWVLKPGEIYVSHGHSPGTTELLHVEDGELTLTVGDFVNKIASGCSAIARTGESHSYANTSTSDVIFTMTVSE
ncbi:HTH-type transcriptional regulator SutR [compost metagenome]